MATTVLGLAFALLVTRTGMQAKGFVRTVSLLPIITPPDDGEILQGNPELVPTGEQSSLGLLDEFPPYDDIFDPVNRVLLPRADIATETLAEGLRERGWEIEDVTAYRTVRAAPPPAHTREMIKTGGFDAVCFTSSSTVRNLVGIAGKPHARTIVACIGPKTAETAAEFGLRVDVQPEVAAVGPLVEALAEQVAGMKLEERGQESGAGCAGNADGPAPDGGRGAGRARGEHV